MSHEFHFYEEAKKTYKVNQATTKEGEINIPTRFGVLLVQGMIPLVASTYGIIGQPYFLNDDIVRAQNIRTIITSGVYYCGVMSVKSDRYKLLAHAPSPVELESIVNSLLLYLQGKSESEQPIAQLYLNTDTCNKTFPQFINGQKTYEKVLTNLSNNHHLKKSDIISIDEKTEIILE